MGFLCPCVVRVCRKQRWGGGVAASHGLLCGMSLPSRSHEMGKHEIKVEKTHKGVEGGRLGPGWGQDGGWGGWRVPAPQAPESTRPHGSMKRALMRTWLLRLCRIKSPNPSGCQRSASMSHFITLSQQRHQMRHCWPFQSHDTSLKRVAPQAATLKGAALSLFAITISLMSVCDASPGLFFKSLATVLHLIYKSISVTINHKYCQLSHE